MTDAKRHRLRSNCTAARGIRAESLVLLITDVEALLDAADELARAHEVHAALEAALRDLDGWAEAYLTPRSGMGADLPRHDLPMLAPSAANALRQRVAVALKASRGDE